MELNIITSESRLPLSEVPAGTVFMTVLNDSASVYMVLDASRAFPSEGNYIFYYRLGDVSLEKIEMSKAKELYVYIVQSVGKCKV